MIEQRDSIGACIAGYRHDLIEQMDFLGQGGLLIKRDNALNHLTTGGIAQRKRVVHETLSPFWNRWRRGRWSPMTRGGRRILAQGRASFGRRPDARRRTMPACWREGKRGEG